MLEQGMETGNFFEKMGEKDGIWRCKDPMRWSMEQRLHKKRSPEQIRRLYYNAGLYYELEGDLPKALEMYKIYDDTESISRLLVANARKNAASDNYYELRKYYLELPEEIIRENPVLMMGMSLLQSILMNVEESERWYHELEEYQKRAEGSEAREARGRLITLDISLPHRGITGMTDLLRAAGVLLTDRKVCIPELSVTSNLPSMMNGGKDFCEWSRRDKELAGSIGQVVEFVLGKYGKGLVPLALAESFQEKGQDDYEVMALIQKGRMQADSGGKIEQVFVANGLLCRMYLIRQDLEEAIHVMTTFRERCEKEAPRLLDNIDAFLCRLHLYRGDTAEILAWMDTAPDENREFYILERFRYLTKARVYLQQGKYEAACNLLQQLLYYAREMKRTYIYIESTLLLAVTCYRMEREAWTSLLQEAVSEAESYHFVRDVFRIHPGIHHPPDPVAYPDFITDGLPVIDVFISGKVNISTLFCVFDGFAEQFFVPVDMGRKNLGCRYLRLLHHSLDQIHASWTVPEVNIDNACFAGKHTAQSRIRHHADKFFKGRLRRSMIGNRDFSGSDDFLDHHDIFCDTVCQRMHRDLITSCIAVSGHSLFI